MKTDLHHVIAVYSTLLDRATWAWIAALIVLSLAAALLLFVAGLRARDWIKRRLGLRRLELFANHPANRPRKETP